MKYNDSLMSINFINIAIYNVLPHYFFISYIWPIIHVALDCQDIGPLPLVFLPVLGFPVLGFPVVGGIDGFAVEVCLGRGGEGIFAHAIFL